MQRVISKQDPLTNSMQRETSKQEATEVLDRGELPGGEGDVLNKAGDDINRHNVSPHIQLYIPQEDSFPLALKYTDVVRQTQTDLDSAEERAINDNWRTDGATTLSDDWLVRIRSCQLQFWGVSVRVHVNFNVSDCARAEVHFDRAVPFASPVLMHVCK